MIRNRRVVKVGMNPEKCPTTSERRSVFLCHHFFTGKLAVLVLGECTVMNQEFVLVKTFVWNVHDQRWFTLPETRQESWTGPQKETMVFFYFRLYFRETHLVRETSNNSNISNNLELLVKDYQFHPDHWGFCSNVSFFLFFCFFGTHKKIKRWKYGSSYMVKRQSPKQSSWPLDHLDVENLNKFPTSSLWFFSKKSLNWVVYGKTLSFEMGVSLGGSLYVEVGFCLFHLPTKDQRCTMLVECAFVFWSTKSIKLL